VCLKLSNDAENIEFIAKVSDEFEFPKNIFLPHSSEFEKTSNALEIEERGFSSSNFDNY
jgi:hypothetical protein